jgi:hypothetical protein
MRSICLVVLASVVAGGVGWGVTGDALAQPADSAAARHAPKIPCITAEDPFPRGCVDCHINLPQQSRDVRLSTLLKAWAVKVEPDLLRKAQAAAPAGVMLKGRHPAVTSALQNIPAGCIKCHGRDSKKAPSFTRLIHVLHLDGGDSNHYLTEFQGACTLCHKLDAKTGVWSIPSGPEP